MSLPKPSPTISIWSIEQRQSGKREVAVADDGYRQRLQAPATATASYETSGKVLAMTPTALIITLQMDADATAQFTEMRKAHFPAHRNWLAAHITLFHALPLAATDDVLKDAAELANVTDAFAMQVDRLLFLGGGVAYAMSSAQGMSVRRHLATRWETLLERQDRAWHGRLHVTVQNKVQSQVARALHTELERNFTPYEIRAIGLQVWQYVGGPWQHLATFPFADASTGQPRMT